MRGSAHAMHGHAAFRFGALGALASLYACGGSGGAMAPVLPAALTAPVPVTAGAIVSPTGPITLLNGTSLLGSALDPASSAAILAVASPVTPKEFSPGSTIGAQPLAIDESAVQTPAAAVRGPRAAAVAPLVAARGDADVHLPDVPFGRRLRRELRDIAARAPVRSVLVSQTLHARSFDVGDRHTFELAGAAIDGSNLKAAPIAMPATLVAHSAHANVWLDDAVARDPAAAAREFPSGSSDFTAVATRFESIFTVETQAFGPAYTTGIVNFASCNPDGTPRSDAPARPDTTGASDPHINIVISDELGTLGEGGYFYGLDLLDQAEANCVAGSPKPTVNGLPMIVIESDSYAASGSGADSYPAHNETYWLSGDMPQTVAHEFQHYLHFVNKYLQQHIDHPGDPSAGTLDDAYIDEGCSVLAQDLVAAAPGERESPLFVRAFLLEPADFSLTAFAGFQPDALTPGGNTTYGYHRNTAGNYGYAYLFIRYLYDRFGPRALKAIYAETNFGQGRDPDTGPATAAADGEPFAALFRDFITALAAHSGGSVPPLSADPAYRFDAGVILRGSVQTYSRRLPPNTIRNIVQPGPLNPEIWNGNVPSGLQTMIGGRRVTMPLLDGGAVFMTPQSPWPHGATLSASGPTSGGGSLSQGALPTPSPAYF